MSTQSKALTAAEGPGPDRGPTKYYLMLIVAKVVSIGMIILAPLSSEATALWGIGLMLALIFAGVPVAVSMGLVGVLGLYSLQGLRGLSASMAAIPYDVVTSWSLTVLPMFILMGLLLWRSGATDKLYGGMEKWLSWLPGGLAITTNAAGAALGAASGSTLGIAYALGRVGIPAMLSAGYPKRLAVASVLMAGSGGQLIPPSILLVVYAGIASTSVGPQLLAGFVPGFLLVGLYSVAIVVGVVIINWRRPGAIVQPPKPSMRNRLSALKDIVAVPLVIAGVIGGIYRGVFTATEAGAFGAFFALLLVVWYRRADTFRFVVRATKETAESVGSIFFLVVGALVLGRFLAVSGLTTSFAIFIESMGLTRIQFLIALTVFYIVLGIFMEPLSMMLLTVPIFLPLLPALGIDVIWFGVYVTLMGEIAIVTPPVGILLYVVYGIARDREVSVGQDIAFKDIVAATGWFLPAAALLVVMLILFPALGTGAGLLG